MKILGDDIYIQRGENWSLDFDITNENGDPYMVFSKWKNPYIAITVTAARYEQQGDFRVTYWLDLATRYIEQQDGSYTLENVKKFISTEALYLVNFDVDEILSYYGTSVGGKIVIDDTSDFDIKNFLFYTESNADGNRTYKYIDSYTVVNNTVIPVWKEYSFRLIKQFVTKTWTEQSYLFDIKVLAGESVKEHIAHLVDNTITDATANLWSDTQTRQYLTQIEDEATRIEMTSLYETGAPLMPDYDTKSLILQPANLFVSANIQGGVR